MCYINLGLALDGSVMNVVLTEETDMINQPDVPKSVFDRIQGLQQQGRRMEHKNVKSGLFGTAMNDEDDEEEEEEGEEDDEVFDDG